VLKVKGQDLLFVRDSDKTVKVLSAVCTHEKCTVKYDPAKSNVVCGCHGSSFSLAGAVLSKPATKNLPTYNATLADDKIIVELE
jgi:Rieske Fe-S protein